MFPPISVEFAEVGLIGHSPRFRQTLCLIQKIACYDTSVLILGETGTGKEVAARAMHYLSPRRGHSFVPVNCGAIPDSLLENELFGHERGAFTDARQAQTGLVALANKGTLFLDEVDALSPKAQVALLRFLQDQEYKPLGSSCPLRADLRLIAASNADLQTLTDQDQFRRDLLFRLNIFTLDLPPLRDRRDDIMLLVRHFIERFGDRYHLACKTLHPETVAWMKQYHWPGNVRELENLIHRAFLLSDGPVIRLSDISALLPVDESNSSDPCCTNFNQAKALAIAEFEKRYLDQLLTQTRGNITLAAKQSGKERRALGRLLKKYGIRRERYL